MIGFVAPLALKHLPTVIEYANNMRQQGGQKTTKSADQRISDLENDVRMLKHILNRGRQM